MAMDLTGSTLVVAALCGLAVLAIIVWRPISLTVRRVSARAAAVRTNSRTTFGCPDVHLIDEVPIAA